MAPDVSTGLSLTPPGPETTASARRTRAAVSTVLTIAALGLPSTGTALAFPNLPARMAPNPEISASESESSAKKRTYRFLSLADLHQPPIERRRTALREVRSGFDLQPDGVCRAQSQRPPDQCLLVEPEEHGRMLVDV